MATTATLTQLKPHRHVLDGTDPKPHTRLVIESRDAVGASSLCQTVDVLRPSGLERQRYQLVSAVTSLFPDARLHAMGDGLAVFVCRSTVIRAFYEQVQ